MAYDSARQVVVLFGGFDGTNWWNDTWEWNGLTWTLRSFGGPPPQTDGIMVYDRARSRCVLFGGQSFQPSLSNQTWEWDGTTWSLRSLVGPAAGPLPSGAYHAGLARTIALSYGQPARQWDGTTWSVLPATSQPAQPETLVYDDARARLITFDRLSAFAPSVAELASGSTASSYSFGAGCGSPAVNLAQAAGALPTIGGTGQLLLTQLPAAYSAITVGTSRTQLGLYQLPAALTFLGMPGCTLLQSAEFTLATTPGAAGTATFALPIPNQPSLVGVRLYLQGWAHAPGANAAEFLTSNGIEWLIG